MNRQLLKRPVLTSGILSSSEPKREKFKLFFNALLEKSFEKKPVCHDTLVRDRQTEHILSFFELFNLCGISSIYGRFTGLLWFRLLMFLIVSHKRKFYSFRTVPHSFPLSLRHLIFQLGVRAEGGLVSKGCANLVVFSFSLNPLWHCQTTPFDMVPYPFSFSIGSNHYWNGFAIPILSLEI